MKLLDFLRILDRIAPLRLAESWDNVGLLLGDPAADVRACMTCLTITPEVAREAVSEGADVVVTHHPILFRGAKAIRADVAGADVVWTLARAGIAVVSHHTGWDSAQGGANECIARVLGLKDIEPMQPAQGPECVKFVIFVPDENLEAVRQAAFEAGAGHIGLYDECSFSHPGHGTFRGNEGTNPTIGQPGRREEAAERRLEIICRKSQRAGVMAAIRAAHMYEEPAVDVYPLLDVALRSNEGVGRIGRADESSIRQVAKLAQDGLTSAAVQVALAEGVTPDSLAGQVAIACGAGDDLVDGALASGARVLVSGELRYHTICKAAQAGLTTILVGHHASERMSMELMAEVIRSAAGELRVWAARSEKEPLINLEKLT
ncbi:Nif3-like dinuclear metal center hexameric protein [bacterium]|nr:Nif3-like dinuclear metal center hexameric protein [bacterium]